MTLLVSALSQDCVWQVVDRRLSYPDTGAIASDDTNKAILFARRFLIAYTGPARIAGRGTAEWIAECLASGVDEREGFERLVRCLDLALARWRGPRSSSALEIQAVGWGIDASRRAWAPRLVRISNLIDEDGERLDSVAETVTVFDGLLKPHIPLRFQATGQPVPLELGNRWERVMRRRQAAGAPPREIGRCLVYLVRDVARINRAVGSGVLLSALPLRSVTHDSGITLSSAPESDLSTFRYYPEHTDECVHKGPEVANPGGARIRDFVAYTTPSGDQFVRAEIRIP